MAGPMGWESRNGEPHGNEKAFPQHPDQLLTRRFALVNDRQCVR